MELVAEPLADMAQSILFLGEAIQAYAVYTYQPGQNAQAVPVLTKILQLSLCEKLHSSVTIGAVCMSQCIACTGGQYFNRYESRTKHP